MKNIKYISIGLILITLFSFRESMYFSIEEYYTLIHKLKPLDNPLPSLKPNDWLSNNFEPGQTFNQFIRTVEKPLNIKNKKIYLKPIGKFDTNQVILLNDIKIYLENFYQCPVIIQERLSLKEIPKKAKRKQNGVLQLNTGYINYKVLYPSKPKDALAYMAITATDLFPSKEWNFVFGQADQRNKVGVSSIARYDYPDMEHYNETLARIIKTSTHEIGHMLGIEHCIASSCLMNGSNNLEETDNQPQCMCSECFVKLGWRTNSHLIKRDSALLEYYKEHELNEAKHVKQRLEILVN